MTRLPRRLALWGGAAAIASGGFAFMASNALATTSGGDGAAAVTGYTVSNITYTPQETNGLTVLGVVKFTLTSSCAAPTTCASAYALPKTVSMFTAKKTGATTTAVYGPLLYWTANKASATGRPDGTFAGAKYLFTRPATARADKVASCTLIGTWSTTTGSGTFRCSYEQASSAHYTTAGGWGVPTGGEAGPVFHTFNWLDVEANQ